MYLVLVNKIPYFKYSKKKVHYERNDSNDGAIIFIHGSGEYSFVWEPQLKNLDIDMDLIAIDLPSHGKSDKFEKLNLNIYVEAVQKLIDELEIKRVVLCGHSLGGAVAQQFYFDHPERVVGLILCSTGAKLRVLPVILENTLHNFDTFLNNIPVGAFYRKTKEEIKGAYVEEVSKIEPQVVHKDFKICDNFDVMDKVDSIDVPCLILVGNADKLTPVKYSKFFKDKIENSILKVIENAGHSVMLEKPKHVNKAIKNFIQKKIQNT
ncbi:MAG: alpha/beta fold hydrolase [Candidatus Lokiarchaeota archaeon]|nr:alpha/beta fold hydrolase [Candidatus Lokiarchaeota archaeon]